VNGDALLRGDCGEDAIDRRCHIRESERVVQVLELWRQETTRIVQAAEAADAQKPRRYGRHPELAR
jgi:hypothetical protein